MRMTGGERRQSDQSLWALRAVPPHGVDRYAPVLAVEVTVANYAEYPARIDELIRSGIDAVINIRAFTDDDEGSDMAAEPRGVACLAAVVTRDVETGEPEWPAQIVSFGNLPVSQANYASFCRGDPGTPIPGGYEWAPVVRGPAVAGVPVPDAGQDPPIGVHDGAPLAVWPPQPGPALATPEQNGAELVVPGSAAALYKLMVPGAVLARGAFYVARDDNGAVVKPQVPVPVEAAVPSLRMQLLPVLVAFLSGCTDVRVIDDVFPGQI